MSMFEIEAGVSSNHRSNGRCASGLCYKHGSVKQRKQRDILLIHELITVLVVQYELEYII
jgi:hypothetical protein